MIKITLLAWWTVAIPQKLHRQGKSYIEKLKTQQQIKLHQFLVNIETYLDMLEEKLKIFL